jgi:predicted S18 family serine protease
MELSFRYRRDAAKIKRLKKKVEEETNEYKKELYQIDLDEKIYNQASAELVAKDRMRELKMWSKLKKEFNDGSFDTKDVNTHQLESYGKIMQNKAKTLTEGSSQPEVFNVVGQLETIRRVKKDGELEHKAKKEISNKETFYNRPR